LGSLLDRGSIARRDREIVILRTCARCGSEYEWGIHVAVFAARCGLTPEEVAASLRTDTDHTPWSARDRLLVRLADELHDSASISEALWGELAGRFRADQLIELVVLAGFYHTVSFLTNAIQIEPEEAAPRFR
jgi:alkylhydroperoxidase family enzyme